MPLFGALKMPRLDMLSVNLLDQFKMPAGKREAQSVPRGTLLNSETSLVSGPKAIGSWTNVSMKNGAALFSLFIRITSMVTIGQRLSPSRLRISSSLPPFSHLTAAGRRFRVCCGSTVTILVPRSIRYGFSQKSDSNWHKEAGKRHLRQLGPLAVCRRPSRCEIGFEPPVAWLLSPTC